MRITIEHEGRVVQYNFQDGVVAEVSMHRNEDGSTRDFTFTIKGVHHSIYEEASRDGYEQGLKDKAEAELMRMERREE